MEAQDKTHLIKAIRQLVEAVESHSVESKVTAKPKSIDAPQYLDENYQEDFDNEDSFGVIDVTDDYRKSYIIGYDEDKENEKAQNEYKDKNPTIDIEVINSFKCFELLSIEAKNFYLFFKSNFEKGYDFPINGNFKYIYLLVYQYAEEECIEKSADLLAPILYMKKIAEKYPFAEELCSLKIAEKRQELIEKDEYVNSISFRKYYEFVDKGVKVFKSYAFNFTQVELYLLTNINLKNEIFTKFKELGVAILKVYFQLIKDLNMVYAKKNSNIDIEFRDVAFILYNLVKKHVNNNGIFCYPLDDFILKDIYTVVFKLSQNQFYEAVGIHQKAYDWQKYKWVKPINEWLEKNVYVHIKDKIPGMVADALAQNSLLQNTYEFYPTLWKNKYKKITLIYGNDPQQFLNEILKLSKENSKNKYHVSMYFTAIKFMIPQNQCVALVLYLYYKYYNFKFFPEDYTTFKKPNKTILKQLFTNKEQKKSFENVFLNLQKSNDLEAAYQAVLDIFVVKKRKQIVLNNESITAVQNQHSGTVSLLNAYLQEESELPAPSAKVAVPIQPKPVENTEIIGSRYLKELKLSEAHVKTLDYFKANQYHVLKTELEIFCKGLSQFTPTFPNKLIENINDICFETLDDLLIEETDGTFTVNESYFAKISN